MRWWEFQLTTDFASSDSLQALLLDVGAGGVELDDPEFLEALEGLMLEADEPLPNVVLPPERPVMLKAYFPDDDAWPTVRQAITQSVARLAAGGLIGSAEIGERRVSEEDSANAWRQYFTPLNVGQRFVVVPSWLANDPNLELEQSRLPLVLDPGMAFGTGNHPSTALCLELLEDLVGPSDVFIDVGTGSGILAIACAKLGARGFAVDIDSVAIEAATANLTLNRAGGSVACMKCDITRAYEVSQAGILPATFSVVIANIVPAVLMRLMPDLARLARGGGALILSGIIEAKVDDVLAAARASGLREPRVHSMGDWRAIVAWA